MEKRKGRNKKEKNKLIIQDDFVDKIGFAQ
jgi:hypothetical protein